MCDCDTYFNTSTRWKYWMPINRSEELLVRRRFLSVTKDGWVRQSKRKNWFLHFMISSESIEQQREEKNNRVFIVALVRQIWKVQRIHYCVINQSSNCVYGHIKWNWEHKWKRIASNEPTLCIPIKCAIADDGDDCHYNLHIQCARAEEIFHMSSIIVLDRLLRSNESTRKHIWMFEG